MAEPDFVAQTFEAGDWHMPLNWWRKMARLAIEKGCTWPRYSWDDERRGLLIEAWKVQPSDHGPQRWSMVEAETKS